MILAALAAFALAAPSVHAAATITVSNTAPTVGAYDISQLSTAGGAQFPDTLNYYTDNNSGHGGGNPGQTFTTGSLTGGYNLTSVSVPVRDAGNGGGSGSLYNLYVDTISGANATQIFNTQFTSPGFSTGQYATFTLPGALHLAANTTYGYAISNASSQYSEFNNAGGNPYSGGQLALINPGGGTGAVTYGSSQSYDATFALGLNRANYGRSIGINFAGGQNAADTTAGTLAPTDTAGVVAQQDWNNEAGASGTSGTLKDNSGLLTTATVSYNSTDIYSTGGATANGDEKLLHGYLDNNSTANTDTVTVSNIPYSKYDVYVYVGSDGPNRTGSVTIGGTTYDYQTMGDPGGVYTQTTDTTGAYPLADYALFSGLTGSSFTVDQNVVGTNAFNNGLFGVEVVDATPEPSQIGMLALMGLGLGGLILKARKRGSSATTNAS